MEIMIKRAAEARYAYYRRCQVFRRNGEQCRAPAETGAHICYAHARQQAMAERRAGERRALLEHAAAEMRRRGRIGFEPTQIGLDFKAIQVTIAMMAQGLIEGRIDCKTAGRLAVELQTAAKLLWMRRKAISAANNATTRRGVAPSEPGLQGLKPNPIKNAYGPAEARALIRSSSAQGVTIKTHQPAVIIHFPVAISTSLMPRAA